MSIYSVIWYVCLSGFHTVLPYLVLVWVSLFSLCSSIFLWRGTLFIQSFCSFFILPFVWLTLFLLLFDVPSCSVLLTLFAVQIFNWSLLVWALFICVCFSVCFRMSSRGSVTVCLSNWLQRYCLAVICVGIMCLLFLVISHPVFCYAYCVWSVVVVMVTLSSFCVKGQWSTIIVLNHYVIPYWNRRLISGIIMVLMIFCLPIYQCFKMFFIVI